MSQAVGGCDISGKVVEGTGVKQYYLVIEGTAANQVKVSGTGAERVVGVVQTGGGTAATDIAAGRAVAIRIEGTSKFVSAGSISRGDRCTSNGDGRVKVTVADKEYVVCHALEAGTTAGDIFEGVIKSYTLSI